MAQSLVRVILHVVFATKHRRASLPEWVQNDLEAYVTGILQNLDCPTLAVGFVEDHGHLGLALNSRRSTADVVREVKTGSSVWLKSAGLDDFAWQGGYGAFSVASSGRDRLVHYIRRQREHHRRKTLVDEYMELLKKHGVAFDEKHLWR